MFDASYKTIFEARGASYDKAMRDYPQARREEFAQLVSLARLRQGQAVCDFPAGGGYMADYMPPDVTLTLVETAETFFTLSQRQRRAESLLVADGKLPFADGALDSVLSLAGLHHNDDQAGFFAEARRVLKIDGVLCMADVAQGSPVARFLDTVVGAHLPEGHTGLYLNSATARQIEAAGFIVKSAAEMPLCWHFDSIVAMLDFCRNLFGIVSVTDDTLLQGIRDTVGFTQADSGGVQMYWSLFYLRANKVA